MSEDLYKRFNLDYLVPASDAGTKTGMSNAEIQYNLYKLSQVFDEVSKLPMQRPMRSRRQN